MSTQCPQLDQLPETVRTYWEEKQQELGEGLVKFSYGIFVNPIQCPAKEKSGIIYLMERNLWFEDFPKPPLFILTKAQEYKKTLIQIPRASINQVELVKQQVFEERFFERKASVGLFQNILGIFRPDPIYLIISENPPGEPSSTHVFRELNEPEEWAQILQTHEQ